MVGKRGAFTLATGGAIARRKAAVRHRGFSFGVSPLPFAMRPPVLLISTDFDGTLVEHGNPAPFSPLLVETLTALRARGVRWAINTGRTLPWLVDGLKTFAWPIHPDFAITAEREIHQPTTDGQGWRDLGDWNATCARRHRELIRSAEPVLEQIIRFVERETHAELRYARHADPRNPTSSCDPCNLSGVVATSDAEMDGIVAFVDRMRVQVPNFSHQRNSIYLSFCHADYDKGTALAELARQIGVPHASVMAIGDHQNDLSMLNGKHAGYVACPGNSIGQVKATVRAAGGYVAAAGYSAGVLEALQFYCGELGA